MKEKKTQPIHVSVTTYAAIKRHARENALTLADAVDVLVVRAIKRKAAIDRYNKANR